MQLARFLNKVFKKGGFVLTDANSKDYIIGEPDNNPIRLKILNKNLHYKLLFCLLYTSPSPRDAHESRMPSSA